MRYPTKIALALGLAASAAFPASAAASYVTSTTEIAVDSRSATPATTGLKLLSGINYVVTATGTVSNYGQTLWNQPAGSYFVTCGTTEPVAFSSPGQPTTDVGGSDAEFLFAGLARYGCGNFVPPIVAGGLTLSTNGGSSFENPTPLGAAPAAPHPTHTYSYVVKGAGKPLQLLLADGERADNNGIVKTTVRVASNVPCLLDGWKRFGSFQSRSECKAALDLIG